jgi:hypothetical protein
MANQVYVEVAHFTVKDTFDNNYKSTLPKVMAAAAEKAIKRSSKLTTKRPSDKSAEGFSLGGALSLKKTATGATGKIMMQLNHWPKNSLFAMPQGGGTADAGSDLDEAIKDLVETIVDDVVMKQVIKVLENQAK